MDKLAEASQELAEASEQLNEAYRRYQAAILARIAVVEELRRGAE